MEISERFSELLRRHKNPGYTNAPKVIAMDFNITIKSLLSRMYSNYPHLLFGIMLHQVLTDRALMLEILIFIFVSLIKKVKSLN